MPDASEILAEKVSFGGSYKSFGEFTLTEVESRADELRAAAEVPAMAGRMAPVASAWRGLAKEMKRAGAATVADLDLDDLPQRAERLRIVPPGGSLL